MACFDIIRFELASSVSEDEFRAADTEMQHWCYLNLPGIMRRTTARNQQQWIVVHLFESTDQCGIGHLDSIDEPVRQWASMIDRGTISHETYSLL